MFLLLGLFSLLQAETTSKYPFDKQHNTTFIHACARFFDKVINFIPRQNQTIEYAPIKHGENITETIKTFTDVAVIFLTAPDRDSSLAATCIGKYALAILFPMIVTAVFFAIDLAISIWWCIRQCSSSKQPTGPRPSPCGPCRDRQSKKMRCFCRICYGILGLFVIFGLVCMMVASLSLNTAVKSTFDAVDGVIDYFDEAIVAFKNISGVGTSLLDVTAGTVEELNDLGLEKATQRLSEMKALYDEIKYLHVDLGSSAAPSTEVTTISQSEQDAINDALEALPKTDVPPKTLYEVCKASKPVQDLRNRFKTLKFAIETEASYEGSVNIDFPIVWEKLGTPLTSADTTLFHEFIDSVDSVKFTPDTSAAPQTATAQINAYITKFDKFFTALNSLKANDGSNCPVLETRTWPDVTEDSDESSSSQSSTSNDESIDVAPVKTAIDEILNAAKIANFNSLTAYESTLLRGDWPTPKKYNDFIEDHIKVIEPKTKAVASLSSPTEKIDTLFYDANHMLARATRYMNGLDGFVGEFKTVYESVGNAAFYTLVGIIAVFALIMVLSFLCTLPLCAKDNLLCCSICIQSIMSIIVGILVLVMMLISLLLMDVYKDIWPAENLKKIEPVIEYVLKIPLSDDLTEANITDMKNKLCPTQTPSNRQFIPLLSKANISSLPHSRAKARLASYKHNEDITPIEVPSSDEFLPFVCLKADTITDFFLRTDGSEPQDNPFMTDFINPMTNSFGNITDKVEAIAEKQDIKAQVTPRIDTSIQAFDEFVANEIQSYLGYDSVNTLLYGALNIVFNDLPSSATLFWMGGFLMMVCIPWGKTILMCGRDLYPKPKRVRRKINQQPQQRQNNKKGGKQPAKGGKQPAKGGKQPAKGGKQPAKGGKKGNAKGGKKKTKR
ncbi:hypothetical protein BLNAU_309 [Blattamonas nauphoetae]|uniref:Uncharacterized protein n=1 Tax=Blattamonas nauphoetae TaxID=2049346 RepID=A0ABQ9YMM6_9EUKA|nr:hypothetical protein BLNAU_309 [Blattamonas nauphoetae]